MIDTSKPKRRGAPFGSAITDTTFARWRVAMGYNKKQVTAPGLALGLTKAGAINRNRGTTEPSLTDLLAMSALRAGLPPWSPEADPDIAAARAAMELVQGLAESKQRAPSKIR